MRVFVSYSFADSELHLLTLLFEKFRQGQHHVESSDTFYNEYKISNSELFLGIITNNSDSINQVVNEWKIAQKHKVNSILLIEDGVKIEDNTINHIRFNRNDSKPAIDKLFGVQKSNTREKEKNDALVGVGILIGVAALIALLAGAGKK